MSGALIKVDMFSNSPQERPGETVSKKNRPQMYPWKISSPRRQMGPGGGREELQGSLDQKQVSQFSLGILWTEKGDVIVSILLDRPN